MARRKGCGLKQPKAYPKAPKAYKPPPAPKKSDHEKLYAKEARQRSRASKPRSSNGSARLTPEDFNISDEGLGVIGWCLLIFFVLGLLLNIKH